MLVGVPKETVPGECRVALVPALVPRLRQAGLDVLLQSGAGAAAALPGSAYLQKGAPGGPGGFAGAGAGLKVRAPATGESAGMKGGGALIRFLQPYAKGAGVPGPAAR